MVYDPSTNWTLVTEFVLLGFTSHPDMAGLLFGLFLVMYAVTLVGNGLIMAVVWSDPVLHSPMYIFLGSLSCSETAYTLVVIPRMLCDLLAPHRSLPLASCATQMFFFVALGVADCLLLTAMAWDRYVAICRPLHYGSLMSQQICWGLVLGSICGGFVLSSCLTGMIFSLPFCAPNHIPHFFCDIPPVLSRACPGYGTIEVTVPTLVAMTLIIPFSFIMLSYACILVASLRMDSTRRCHKAFSTCGAHLTVVILHYGCAIVTYAKPKSSYMEGKDHILSVSYTIVIPMLNPLIYTLRNNEVKGALRKVVNRGLFLHDG
ncbi:olfactory receptor 10J1-like isoform X1 [Heteronotia binoei]|uniref:olfactory receptor 10J1-like isoform X1 n=1 Tax=Heteronotia binoei TaxID=13085 RepID=UPI002930970F|nr:olfactory receptor 10J1-like isoform X1 [Heteronotia binoei]